MYDQVIFQVLIYYGRWCIANSFNLYIHVYICLMCVFLYCKRRIKYTYTNWKSIIICCKILFPKVFNQLIKNTIVNSLKYVSAPSSRLKTEYFSVLNICIYLMHFLVKIFKLPLCHYIEYTYSGRREMILIIG